MAKTGKNGFPMKNRFFHPRGQKGLSTPLCGHRPNFLGQKHFKMMPGSDFGIFGIFGQKIFLTHLSCLICLCHLLDQNIFGRPKKYLAGQNFLDLHFYIGFWWFWPAKSVLASQNWILAGQKNFGRADGIGIYYKTIFTPESTYIFLFIKKQKLVDWFEIALYKILSYIL